ncbi:MAG: type II secretion system F family protein [Kiritimatiellae bacterium]|nr:type II secretion system F family protein [Kiritimatiellia bacterium]
MPNFNYRARSKDGKKSEGSVSAPDRRAALAELERQGLIPISVTESLKKRGSGAAKSFWKLQIGGAKLKMKALEVLLFTSELSDLLEAGMTLGAALNCLANQGDDGAASGRVAADLRDRIMRGEQLSDAMAAHPESFPPLYSNMIRAGEASGAMIEILRRLVEHYERSESMRSRIKSAMAYPMIVLIFGVVTIAFAMVKVIPQFSKIFESLGDSLPLPTQILVSSSDFMVRYGVFVLGAIIFGIVLFRRHINTKEGRFWWDGLRLRAPLVKGIIASGAFSSLAYTMRTLLANGVNVLHALRIAEETCGNAVIAGALRNARERVTDGTTISGPLAGSNVFPKMMTDMMSIGEQSGDMPRSLNNIGKRYEREMDRNITIFTNALEPLLIVGIGSIVGFVAISILMAVFKVTSSLGAG